MDVPLSRRRLGPSLRSGSAGSPPLRVLSDAHRKAALSVRNLVVRRAREVLHDRGTQIVRQLVAFERVAPVPVTLADNLELLRLLGILDREIERGAAEL